MSRNVLETVMGGVVLAVAVFFLAFAYTRADLGTVAGYEVTARFSSVDGVTAGTDVRISGVKVGSVVDVRLDMVTYQAEIAMTIDPAVELTTDTSASLAMESLLGGNHIALQLGADEELIEDGGSIYITQSGISLDAIIGNLIHGMDSGGSDGL